MWFLFLFGGCESSAVAAAASVSGGAAARVRPAGDTTIARWRRNEERSAATLLRAVRGGAAGFLTGIGDPSSCSCHYGAGLVSGSRCGSGWSSCRRNPTCVNRGAWISFSYSVGDVPPRGGEAGRQLMKTDTLVTSLNSQYIQEQHTWFLIQMWWIYHIIWTIRHT